MEKCSKLEIYNSMTPQQTPFDNGHVIWQTGHRWPQQSYNMNLSAAVWRFKNWLCTSVIVDVQTVRGVTHSPSCSSSYVPTDGTLRHTWALTHTTDLCSHQDPQVSFQTETVRYFVPSLCGSVFRLSALQGCTTPPPRKALAAVYHWLYWEHLMAQSWWILWAVDLLITVLS